MASKVFVGFLLLQMALFLVELCSALMLTITPEHFKFETEKGVTVKCELDTAEAAAKEIMALKIAKQGEKAIVIMHPNSAITTRNSAKNRVQTSGKITDPLSKSYLQFVIKEPRPEDRGTYSCHIYYMDEAGELVDDKATDFLTVEDPMTKAMKDNVQRVMTWINKTDARVRALKEKSGPIVAFSATSMNHLLKPAAGQTMVFPDIIFQQGQGYSTKTGVFTAPRKGLYVFHLILTTACRDCFIKAEIRANSQGYARLRAVNSEDSRQGSVSTVLELNRGDSVSVRVVDETNGVYLFFKKNCVFAGYLIKAM